MKQWSAGINSGFAEVTWNNILQMQNNITTASDTKKATKLGMKVFRDNKFFNTQFAHMSSVLSSDRQASLLEQQLSFHSSISMFHPSQFNFIEQNVSIQENLNVTISL